MGQTNRKILFSIIPGSGHLNPVVPLALALQDRGHEVRVAAPASSADAITAAGLSPVAVGRDWDGHGPSTPNPAFENQDSLQQLRWLVGSTAPQDADDLVKLAGSWRPDLIIRDNLAFGGWVAGEELGIPVVVFGSTGVMPLPIAQMLLGETLAELRAHRGLAPDPELTGIMGRIYLDPTPPSLTDPFSALVEQRRPLRPDAWAGTVSGLLPGWLDSLGARPIVYATLGTVVNDNPVVLGKLIEAVAGMDVDVVMTIGSNGDASSLGELPANVHVAGYIPQDVLLDRVAAVVCHSGRGTVHGALAAAVPLCLIPLGTDQPLVAAACEKAGVAAICATTTVNIGPNVAPLAVPADLDPQLIRQGIERALSDDELRRRVGEVAAEIAAMPAPAEVAVMLEEVADGSPVPVR